MEIQIIKINGNTEVISNITSIHTTEEFVTLVGKCLWSVFKIKELKEIKVVFTE